MRRNYATASALSGPSANERIAQLLAMNQRNAAEIEAISEAMSKQTPGFPPSKPMFKLLYSRKETAEALALSVATIDVMIARGLLRAYRKGARVLVHRDEIERVSLLDTPRTWPAKVNGKTTRTREKIG